MSRAKRLQRILAVREVMKARTAMDMAKTEARLSMLNCMRAKVVSLHAELRHEAGAVRGQELQAKGVMAKRLQDAAAQLVYPIREAESLLIDEAASHVRAWQAVKISEKLAAKISQAEVAAAVQQAERRQPFIRRAQFYASHPSNNDPNNNQGKTR